MFYKRGDNLFTKDAPERWHKMHTKNASLDLGRGWLLVTSGKVVQ